MIVPKLKVKIFSSAAVDKMESEINDFLTSVELIGIEYAMSEDEANLHYSAIVIYKDN